jgi:glycosyltransferase involved in cell wall biosynthesis
VSAATKVAESERSYLISAETNTRTSSLGGDPELRRLRVLVLDEELPYPPDAGKRIRTWNLLRRLAQRHTISLLCYGEPHDPSAGVLEQAGIRVHLVAPPASMRGSHLYLRLFANLFSRYPYSVEKHFSKEFQSRVHELAAAEQVDLVHCEWTPYSRFANGLKENPVLITSHNVESQIWFRRAKQSRGIIQRLFFNLQAIKMERFERRALQNAQVVTAVTTEDVRVMRSWNARSVRLVENGVDLEYFKPCAEIGNEPELLFLGSLDWFPNIDALDYLLECIMPIVRSLQPSVRLRIVGRRPSKELATRVAKLGWAELVSDVPDVRPYLAQASVVVVPLRIGGGSRIKILEALASGKALVSTSVGAEGLAVTDGENIRIADEPAQFAQGVLELLASPEGRHRLGRSGRALVEKRYGWQEIAKLLESAWFEACSPDRTDDLRNGATQGQKGLV